MRLAAVLVVALLTVFAAIGWLGVAASASQTATLSLQPGRNIVTWNGAAPFAIDNFADTPVNQIHRWDAVGQQWLSHVVGQDGATLPERHLLPRVQYLLIAEATHEVEVPNPLDGIDPHADLRLAVPPDDPLRFEAYWPNEDSPLEDLIVLRPDDERLSVKAEIAGGIREIEVYWLLDGQLNHQGLASDDVELLPGKHDDARLTAVDASGQAIVVNLPRVVKLTPLELPEMSYAVWTHTGNPWNYDNYDDVETAIRSISEAGFGIFEFEVMNFDLGIRWGNAHDYPKGPRQPFYEQVIRVIDAARNQFNDLFVTFFAIPGWAAQGDISRGYGEMIWWQGPTTDPLLLQQSARIAAQSYPELDYWMVSHESNLSGFWLTVDPYRDVERIRASALGIWSENPSAAIVANGLVPGVRVPGSGSVDCQDYDRHGFECAVDTEDYLQALYDHGFARWVDIVAYHPNWSLERTVEQTNLIHAVMSRNGDGDTPLWATSVLISSADPGHCCYTAEERAVEMVRTLEWLGQDERVTSAHIYVYRDDRIPGEDRTQGPLMYGLVEREFVNGQPVPTPTWTAVVEFLRSQSQDK